MKICAISPISGGNDSRKRHEKRLIFKIGTIHPHGLNERFSFIWSHLFIVSVFVQQAWTKALKSHLFTPLFMFIHLPLIYFAPPPRLLIDFKNSKWLTYFCILLCICYCFSHLIGLRSVTWLFLLYKFTRFFIYFLFLSDEGPMLETLDYTIRIGSIPTFLYFYMIKNNLGVRIEVKRVVRFPLLLPSASPIEIAALVCNFRFRLQIFKLFR